MDPENKIVYNSWPVGKLPKEFQRPELDQIKALGYDWKDPRDVVKMFEEKVAKFSGSKYAVAIDCCSHGLFLAIKALERKIKPIHKEKIIIPSRTYVSVPMQIVHAGFEVGFEDRKWSGIYQLYPYDIWDGAVRWTKGMYIGGLHVVSFQIKKRVPIGRGGMILTDSKEDYDYLCRARYDGRNLDGDYMTDNYEYGMGWHYYMTPEDAARGIILMDQIPEENEDTGGSNNYSDISRVGSFLNV
jgi:dTDP-4-amino-4,6-dideoxygalactose transaminase